jgi:threonine/homoserine/homoserine lactone efflux protein
MELILQAFALGFSAGSQPGPFQAYLFSRALQDGWRKTWSVAFAPLLSDGPIILVVLLALAHVPDGLVRGLRVAGGLFLLYLAWGVYRALRQPPGSGSTEKVEPRRPGAERNIFQAALLNVLNPNPWIFWSTVAGPVFLQGWQKSPAMGLGFILGFYAVMITVQLVLVAVFSTAGRLHPRYVRWLNILSGVFLAGFAFYQFYAAWLA